MAVEERVSPTMDEFWILLSMLRVKAKSYGGLVTLMGM